LLAACEQILSAVDYMHKRRIVHRDLKLKKWECGVHVWTHN
jgi:serine/threonine protein kinase